MNELQIFRNDQFGEIRTVEIGGEPWFVGKDIAERLGYSNPRKAIGDHVDDEDKGVTKCDTLGGTQDLTVINESGLYSLVLSSKLPTAKQFKRWVTSEVIPSIRKHGIYATDNVIDNMIADPEFGIKLLSELKAERIKRMELEGTVAIQNQVIAELQPIKDYYDTILSSKQAIRITQIAADYGLSAKKLNKILHEERVQFKVNGQWILYDEYKRSGYTKSETYQYDRQDGTKGTSISTYWTQKGRLFIHKILTSRGIVPIMDRK